ncbi:MAG: AraC family transcriptional regulator [Cyanobacteria bacterium J06621_8]
MDEHKTGHRLVYVNVEIEPEALKSYFPDDRLFDSALEKQLYKEEDWKISFYPEVTSQMRSLAYQLWNAPYHGMAKQIYLQGKVFELLALYLNLIKIESQSAESPPRLKPKTIAALHYAKNILTKHSEHPPSLPQLAQQVGVSQRTLQRGFPTLFKTTVVGYIAQQRLDRAERLLRERKHSVAEVAILVGYGNIGHFSVAFKRRFGITPSQCLVGSKADFEKHLADFE